ncbi:MAG: hypothetical protein K9H26_13000 [Prolixibacteraceae bacterium]|nr:hypothetical protein [Prolixibacteraceae bacterium]
MSSEDYLMRQFRQLAQVLARILGLHEKKEYNQALETIDQTLVTWYNVDLENPEKTLMQYKSQPSNNFEEEKALAELFYQRSKTLQNLKQEEKAKSTAAFALRVFKQIDEQSGHFSIEIQQRIAELDQIIKGEYIH